MNHPIGIGAYATPLPGYGPGPMQTSGCGCGTRPVGQAFDPEAEQKLNETVSYLVWTVAIVGIVVVPTVTYLLYREAVEG